MFRRQTKSRLFSKNRDRLLTSEVAQRLFAEVNERAKKFMSDDHFTVDGTLIQIGVPSDRSLSVRDVGIAEELPSEGRL